MEGQGHAPAVRMDVAPVATALAFEFEPVALERPSDLPCGERTELRLVHGVIRSPQPMARL